MKGKTDMAKKEMKRLRGDNIVATGELTRISKSMEKQNVGRGRNTLLTEPKNKAERIRYLFFQGTFVRPFFVIIVLFPVGRMLTGGTCLSFYMIQILENSPLPVNLYTAAAALTIFELGITLLCSAVGSLIPRKPLLIMSSLLMAVGSLLFGTTAYFEQNSNYASYMEIHSFIRWIPLIGLGLMFTGLNGGFRMVTSIYMGQLLPANARSIGLGLIGTQAYTLLLMQVKFVPYLDKVIGIHGLFWSFATISFGVSLFSYFCVPEITGKTMEEIEDHYRKICNKPQTEVESSSTHTGIGT